MLKLSPKITDKVANTVVKKVFGTTSLDEMVDIQSDRLKPLADATPNAKFASGRQNRCTVVQVLILHYLPGRSRLTLAGSSRSEEARGLSQ